MDRTRKIQINKCDLSKCLRENRNSRYDSASSGVTHYNGYRGKIHDIWHKRGDEKFFPDWLKEIKKNRSLIKGREKHLKITTPYVVTHTCVVELIFKMCKDLKQPADTRYRTVELFDRFIANQFIDLMKAVKKKQNQLAEWNNNIPRVSNQALLRVISCIQLASKYCAHSSIVSPKVAHIYLIKRGQNHSVQNILTSEIRVFKSLDFNIGVPTLLVFVDILLPLIREYVHDKIYTVCINMIDIVYLQRHQIFKKLSDKIISNWQQSHSDKLSFSLYEFDGLYCGAACITSAVEIYYPNDKDLVLAVNNKLADFVERPSNDILTFSMILLQTIGMT
ncbi:hypothetical protein PGB90_003095 [Kerria lacca]